MTTHDLDKVIAALKEAGAIKSDWVERLYAIAFEAGRKSVDTPIALAEAYRCGKEMTRLEKECDQLREQVTLLRNVLHFANAELREWYEELMGEDYNSVEINEALAATSPTP